MVIRIIITIFAAEKESKMSAPKIDASTAKERMEYVSDKWQCLSNCEICGRCSMLRGRDAEIVYADYIEGRREYMDITFELRSINY